MRLTVPEEHSGAKPTSPASPTMLAGAVVVFVAGDLRARAEERVLVAQLGERYHEYAARARRLLPGVYRSPGRRSRTRFDHPLASRRSHAPSLA